MSTGHKAQKAIQRMNTVRQYIGKHHISTVGKQTLYSLSKWQITFFPHQIKKLYSWKIMVLQWLLGFGAIDEYQYIWHCFLWADLGATILLGCLCKKY